MNETTLGPDLFPYTSSIIFITRPGMKAYPAQECLNFARGCLHKGKNVKKPRVTDRPLGFCSQDCWDIS
jgi:hypothetical protein